MKQMQQYSTAEPKSRILYIKKKTWDRYNLSPLKNFVPEIRYKFQKHDFSIPNNITIQ